VESNWKSDGTVELDAKRAIKQGTELAARL
jgi:hypothetical protein